jgi:mRNA interferase RelE/StbE
VDLPRWEREISRRAEQELKRLSPEMKRRVVDALDGLMVAPWQGDIKKHAGMPTRYRLRIGDWRLIFQPDEERRAVDIVAVSHRSRAYRG